jgi:hypothetical protein
LIFEFKTLKAVIGARRDMPRAGSFSDTTRFSTSFSSGSSSAGRSFGIASLGNYIKRLLKYKALENIVKFTVLQKKEHMRSSSFFIIVYVQAAQDSISFTGAGLMIF